MRAEIHTRALVRPPPTTAQSPAPTIPSVVSTRRLYYARGPPRKPSTSRPSPRRSFASNIVTVMSHTYTAFPVNLPTADYIIIRTYVYCIIQSERIIMRARACVCVGAPYRNPGGRPFYVRAR